MPDPGVLGDASQWATNATKPIPKSQGVTVNQTPTVGSIAQWNSVSGSDGHVACVESVDPGGVGIAISEDNFVPGSAQYFPGGYTAIIHIAEVPQGSTKENDQPYGDLPEREVNDRDRSFAYGESVPVFYGHYWRTGTPIEHEDWTEWTACVDFSAVKGGTMVAYRWDGEEKINWRHYIPHGRDVVERKPSS